MILPRRTAFDKTCVINVLSQLCDKTFNFAKNSKYGYWRGLVSMVCEFLGKRSTALHVIGRVIYSCRYRS